MNTTEKEFLITETIKTMQKWCGMDSEDFEQHARQTINTLLNSIPNTPVGYTVGLRLSRRNGVRWADIVPFFVLKKQAEGL